MNKNNLTISLNKDNPQKLSPLKDHNSTELLPLKPEKVLEKYSQEELDACWEALCINVVQNYQRGKGTFIKNFGSFTFKTPELNLEGTTNEVFRDKKLRYPIFIVSKEFNPNIKPGEYNKVSGIRYFIVKENKNINISNMNYSEIAFSLSMTKDKVTNIIKYLISYINESIEKKKFKNKKMGLLGSLVLNPKHNILAVKFDENFENNILGKNKLLNNIKNKIPLYKSLEDAKNLNIGNYPNLYQTSENLKARNSLITQCQPSAKEYLSKKYDINLQDESSDCYTKTLNPIKNHRNYLYTSINNTNNFFTQRKRHPFKFLNDVNTNKNYSSPKALIKKEEDKIINPLTKLDNNVLKTMIFLKGSMIKDSKDLDINKRGSIPKEKRYLC